MSKTRVLDSERTAIMTDLVRRRHEAEYGDVYGSPGTVVLNEVSPFVGWGRPRYADVLALGVWKSSGQNLHGYEIKASKADLKRELADPEKSRAISRYCNTWTLVVWDDSMLVDGIPGDWGICVAQRDEMGEYELEWRRRPAALAPEPWTRSFICSLVRNAYEQSPAAAYVARAAEFAATRARAEKDRYADATLRGKVDDLVLPLAKFFYGDNPYRWPAEARKAEALIARAVAELQQGILGKVGAA